MLFDFADNQYIGVFWYCKFIEMCFVMIGCYGNQVVASDWSKFKCYLIMLKISMYEYFDTANSLKCVLKRLVAMVTK